MPTATSPPWDLRRRGSKDAHRHDIRVKDAIRKNLRELISQEDIIASDGQRAIKIPLRYLDQYRFKYGTPEDGVGHGEGNVGDVLGRRDDGTSPGAGPPGDQPGDHAYEVDVSIDDLAQMALEDLALPWLEATPAKELVTTSPRFTDIRKKGSLANLDKRRSLRENLKRQASKGNAHVGPFVNDDLRFKVWDEHEERQARAAVYCCMDVSGCHTAGHIIEMANGSYKYVEDIIPGDVVSCVDLSNYKKTSGKVVETISKYSKTAKIFTEDGFSLEPSLQHVYFVYDQETNKLVEKCVAEIEVGEYLVAVSQHGKNAQQSTPVHNLTPDEAYFIGFMLGDGNINISDEKDYYSNTVQITDENVERLKTLQSIVFSTYGLVSHIKFYTRQRLLVYNSEFVRYLLLQFPMLGHKQRQRYIQADMFLENEKARASFISGFFDAEGSVANHSITIINSSVTLLEQLRLMLSFWNIRARITFHPQKERMIGDNVVKAGDFYCLSIHAHEMKLFAEHIGSRCSRKSAKIQETCDKLGQRSQGKTRYVCKENLRDAQDIATNIKVAGYVYNVRYKKSPTPTASSMRNMLNVLKDSPNESLSDLLENTLANRLVLSRVTKIERNNQPQKVYDFEVATHHNYIVNGTLSHNSMSTEKKFIAKVFFFWIVRFLRLKYRKVETVFIAHDTQAHIVPEKDFFAITEGGGTQCSAAYVLALGHILQHHPSSSWNTYLFHFSDGDNFASDNTKCIEIVTELLRHCRMVGYGEIRYKDEASWYGSSGSGYEWSTLQKSLNTILDPHLLSIILATKDDVWKALERFLRVKEEA